MDKFNPIDRNMIQKLREDATRYEETIKEEWTVEGVKRIYNRAVEIIVQSPQLSEWVVSVITLAHDAAFQKPGVMDEVLRRIQTLFPDCEITQSRIASYNYILTLRD